jgi:hypothetical protein
MFGHSVPSGGQPPSWLREALRQAAEMQKMIQRSLGLVGFQFLPPVPTREGGSSCWLMRVLTGAYFLSDFTK